LRFSNFYNQQSWILNEPSSNAETNKMFERFAKYADEESEFFS